MIANPSERRGSFGLKAVYITVALAIGAGGAAWGTLKTQAQGTAEVAGKNAAQIKDLADKLNKLSTGQAVIGDRTKRIEAEQKLIRGDIRLLLRRVSPAPPIERLR